MYRSKISRPRGAWLGLFMFTLAAVGCGRGSGASGSSGTRGQYQVTFNVNVSRPVGGTITSIVGGIADGKINCGTKGGTANACAEVSYPWAQVVTFTATPDPGFKFVGWFADCNGMGPCTVDTTRYGADKSVMAAFEPEAVYKGIYFTVKVTRPAGGTVASDDGQIFCGPARTANVCGPAVYKWGDHATLTVSPEAGYTFAGWTGDCSGTTACTLDTVTKQTDKNVGAVFSSGPTWTVTVARSGTGAGAIAADIPGEPTVTCGAGPGDCTFIVPVAVPPPTVTLAPVPAGGSHFGGWSGDCAGSGSCVLTVAADASASAAFDRDAAGSTVLDSGGGVVTSPTTNVTVTVPPGAVQSSAGFSVSVATAPPPLPPEVPASTTVYAFEPAGQIFATPVTVRLPIPPGVTNPCVWWEDEFMAVSQSPTYQCIGGTVSGGFIEVEVPHFSHAFVATAPATQVIWGSRYNTHILSDGKLQAYPESLVGTPVMAFLPDDFGGVSWFPGAGDVNGLFSIPNLPVASRAIVQVGPDATNSRAFIVQSRATTQETPITTLDVGGLANGRLGLTPVYPPIGTTGGVAEGLPMPIDLVLDGMDPSEQNSEIDLFSVDADTWATGVEGLSYPPFPTSVHVTDLWSARARTIPMNVIDGVRDAIFAQQITFTPFPNIAGYQYRHAKSFARLPAVSVGPDIVPVPTNVTLQPLPQNGLVSVEWDLSAYRAMLQDGTCSTSTSYGNFTVVSQPGAHEFGMTNGETKRTFLQASFAPSLGYASTGVMTFGTGAEPDYARVFGLHWTASVGCNSASIRAPNGVNWWSPGTSIVQYGLYADGGTVVTLTSPAISPPQNVRLDGVPLTAPLFGVSSTSTISWDAPAFGQSDAYRVIVRHFLNGSGSVETVAVVTTKAPFITMPPGLLKPGESYAFLVQAAKGGIEVTKPSHLKLPFTQARVNTPWFTVAVDRFRVGGKVTGLVGGGLTLRTDGQPDLLVAQGASGFTFATPVVLGTPYEVTIAQQPQFPPQVCTVTNGSGAVLYGDVTDIAIDCAAP